VCLFLGSDEKYGAAFCNYLFNESACFVEQPGGQFQVDNVDSIAFCEDIILHPRVPVACLVSEMSARF
jgi:hypothetical protein